MTIELHEQIRKRLAGLAQAYLKRATVIGGTFIGPESMEQLYSADDALPKHGRLLADLQSMIGERPFSTFVTSEAARRFPPREYAAGETAPLTQFAGFDQPAELAVELVESFASLPWEYMLTVELPPAFAALFALDRNPINVSSTIRICLGSEFMNQFSPVPNPTFAWLPSLGSHLELAHWDENGTFFQMRCQGYVAAVGTEAALRAQEEFISFLGLLLAMRLVARPMIFDDLLDNGRSRQIFYRFHAESDGWWQHVFSSPIADSAAGRLRTLTLLKHASTAPRPWFESTVKRVGLAFSSSHGERVRRAAKWLFDSYCGGDSVQKFVQAAVAIEILLGDEEAPKDVGLTELMANRCAYLIGKTPEIRADVLKKFHEIYRVRSKIVHNGKSRLSGAERQLFLELQSLCAQVIDEELYLIMRSQNG